MLFLFLSALLLIFITTNLGILALNGLEKLVRSPIQTDLPGIFLTGLIVSAIYFNIISFWLPVNYLSLIPPAALSIFICIRNKTRYRHILISIRRQVNARSAHFVVVVCILLLLFFYWIKPPTNVDGPGYHYLSILWYEKFKVVPGLANLQGRFGFNPAAFIIEAAYSFSSLTGQAIYPLNGVITGLFFFWVLSRLFSHIRSLVSGVYFLFLFLFLRVFLGNMSSPTSDTLVLICVSYSILYLFECILRGEVVIGKILVPSLILLFAPISKLSAYPALLVLLLLLGLLPKTEKKGLFCKVLILSGLLIYIPWLGRNYILSGYLVYPLPSLELFHPDWKVAKDVLMADYDQIVYGAKFSLKGITDINHLPTVAFRDWFFPWLYWLYHGGMIVEIAVLFAALFSPILWIFQFRNQNRVGIGLLGLWLITYAGSWIWLYTSPDFRYGWAFLSLSFIIPLLVLSKRKNWTNTRIPAALLSLILFLTTLYYIHGVYNIYMDYTRKTARQYTLGDCWLRPLKDARYSMDNNKADFDYKIMQSGVKLYLADRTHDCLNAELTCTACRGITIEMRGEKLEDGFKCLDSELWKILPYLR